jgi:DNA topoisomerase-1
MKPPPVAEVIGAGAPERLVYVSDETPGITRKRRGTGFVYYRPDGRRVDDPAELRRIRALAVPPAYTAVWICPLPHGHIQATGRDARGRKQYRYHPEWNAARDAHKFERMPEFARALPRIRARVKRDLAAGAPRRDAVLATIVRLLDTTMVRVGNDEYARTNGSYGLTTLRRRHVAVQGAQLKLRFRGKSGVQHDVAVEDPAVARIVRRLQTLPGQELFQYVDDDGTVHAVGSADVNAYLREASGGDFTAKDFRTWHGSVHAFELALAPAEEALARTARAKQLLTEVARRLGNTVAVCRKAYVHPRVLEIVVGDCDAPGELTCARITGLSAAERRFLAFVEPVRRRMRRAVAAGEARLSG